MTRPLEYMTRPLKYMTRSLEYMIGSLEYIAAPSRAYRLVQVLGVQLLGAILGE